MVQDGQPNVRADVTPLRRHGPQRGEHLRRPRRRPRPLPRQVRRFLPVGFYYKAFHSKRSCSRSGSACSAHDRSRRAAPRYAAHPHTQSLRLLRRAGDRRRSPPACRRPCPPPRPGAQVVVVDENARRRQRPVPARQRYGSRGHASMLPSCSSVQPMPRSACSKRPVPPVLRRSLDSAGRCADKMTKMRAGSVIVASGAFEQPAVFRNNDLPGVMLGSAMQRLIYRFARAAGQQGRGPRGQRRRLSGRARSAGRVVTVAAVVDLRSAVPPTRIRSVRAVRHRMPAATQWSKAMPTARAVSRRPAICRMQPTASPRQRTTHRLRRLAMSTGWAPAANLLYQAGTRMRFDKTCCSSSCPTSCPRACSPAAASMACYEPGVAHE
jgi:sarcosine oxidase subunit alpha